MGTDSSRNQFNENIKMNPWLFTACTAPRLCPSSDLKNNQVRTAKSHSFICPVAHMIIHISSAVAILILMHMVFSIISTWCLVLYSFSIINCCACKGAARANCSLRDGEPGAEGDPSPGNALTNGAQSHRALWRLSTAGLPWIVCEATSKMMR